MKCPTCQDVNLTMSERQGIEIDYCPQCRGVWLDRGELDKLIERSASTSQSPQNAQTQPQQYAQPSRRPDFDDSDFKHHGQHGYRKQKSWLSEIFD